MIGAGIGNINFCRCEMGWNEIIDRPSVERGRHATISFLATWPLRIWIDLLQIVFSHCIPSDDLMMIIVKSDRLALLSLACFWTRVCVYGVRNPLAPVCSLSY